MRFLLNNFYLCFIIFAGGVMSCSTPSSQYEEDITGLPDDFTTFYKRFLDDSIYQLEHIAFPLQGLPGPNDIDSNGIYIPWEKETWTLHKPIVNIADYTHTFDILSDDLIVETIQQKDAPIALQRRFARMSDGWHLIYYVDMQPISKKQSQ